MSVRPTVYICTSGEYSDYRIGAVFLDRAEAEHYVTFDRDAQIEEHLAGFPEGTRLTRTLTVGRAKNDEHGTMDGPNGYESFREVPDAGEILECKVFLLSNRGRPHIRLHIEGENFERVRKVLSERWAQIEAEWPLIRQAALDGAATWPIP